MKRITTEIEIEAKPEDVWQVLINFENYPNWNPFVRKISGSPAEGETIEIRVHLGGGNGMTFKPKVVKNVPNSEFAWLGRFIFPGLLDGRHEFLIKPILENRVRFRHNENFSGILVWPFLMLYEKDTRKGFEEMNAALKKQVEGK